MCDSLCLLNLLASEEEYWHICYRYMASLGGGYFGVFSSDLLGRMILYKLYSYKAYFLCESADVPLSYLSV